MSMFHRSLGVGRTFGFLLVFATTAAGETPGIYDGTKPRLFPLWNRMGDVSPVLRSVEAVEVSADGRWAVSGGKFGYEVMMWRVADGRMVWSAAHESEVECVALSPDGRYAGSGGEDYALRFWSADAGEAVAVVEHPSGIDAMAWSDDGTVVATGDETGTLRWFDVTGLPEPPKMMAELTVGSTINSVDFTADGSRVVVGGNDQERVDDPERPGKRKTRYRGFVATLRRDAGGWAVESRDGRFDASIKSVRWSPDETRIAAGGFDRHAYLIDVASSTVRPFPSSLRVEAVAFTPDGQYLVVGGHEDVLRFIRVSDGETALEVDSPRVEYIDFSDDGRVMVTAHEDSGLLRAFAMISDTQATPGIYGRLSEAQLDNRDLHDGIEE